MAGRGITAAKRSDVLTWFTNAALSVDAHPVVQGLLAALCTFILEDPTTVGSGLLVADGVMSYWAALIGLAAGIAGGDCGLYWLGRLAANPVAAFHLVSRDSLDSSGKWFDRNLIVAVVTARFIPGMRLPTYVAAGILRVPFVKFTLIAAAASTLWTLILLNLSIRFGAVVLAEAGRYKLPLGAGIVLFLTGMQYGIGKYRRRRSERGAKNHPGPPAEPPRPPQGKVHSSFEFWPPALFYLPVAAYCFLLGLRHRGLLLFTAANPLIYSGGLLLESKSEILSLIPPREQSHVAPWVTFDRQNGHHPDRLIGDALEALDRGGLELPVVVKPDIGQRSNGVRPVYNTDDLAEYLTSCRSCTKLIFQKLVPYPNEAGIIYYRRPGEKEGHIPSITIKKFPVVVGDGRKTIRQLIREHPRARMMRQVFYRRHAGRLNHVLPEGQSFQLVFAGAHCQGSVFENGNHELTPELYRAIHNIASAIPEFYFGRFDLRFRSMEDLKRGSHFQIVEINGVGGEPTHIWDPDTTLVEAYDSMFRHFEVLYEIGAVNRDRGFDPLPLPRLMKDHFTYKRISKDYPLTH